jgi:uncharacterized protein YndB with AHSA1/START domain
VIDGDAVIREFVLPAPAERVFEMFVDPAKLVRWMGISADLDPRPGGRFRFEVVPGQFCEGHYVAVERPNRLVFTWGWTDPAFGLPPGSSRVEVTFAAHGGDQGSTLIRLVHTGLGGDLGLLHDDGWNRFFARLQAVVAGTDAGDYPADKPAARLAELSREPGEIAELTERRTP